MGASNLTPHYTVLSSSSLSSTVNECNSLSKVIASSLRILYTLQLEERSVGVLISLASLKSEMNSFCVKPDRLVLMFNNFHHCLSRSFRSCSSSLLGSLSSLVSGEVSGGLLGEGNISSITRASAILVFLLITASEKTALASAEAGCGGESRSESDCPQRLRTSGAWYELPLIACARPETRRSNPGQDEVPLLRDGGPIEVLGSTCSRDLGIELKW